MSVDKQHSSLWVKLVAVLMAVCFCMAQVNNPGGNGSFNAGSNYNMTDLGNTAIAGPRPWIDPTASAYGADPTGTNDSTTAFANAISACNGNTILVPTGSYKISSLTIANPCTIMAHEKGVHLIRTASTTNSAGSGAAAWIDITASNVRLKGMEIDGQCTANTYGYCTGATGIQGACIDVYGGVSYVDIQDNYIHSCDGYELGFTGSSNAGPSPSYIDVSQNVFAASGNATDTTGAVYIRDCVHDIDIHDNPVMDGSGYLYLGAATVQDQSQAGTCEMYNHQIHHNEMRCAADWCVQAGGFNSYDVESIEVSDNKMELGIDSQGFISIPVAVTGKVIVGNQFNTHFRDFMVKGTDGGCTSSSSTITSSNAAFNNPNITGRSILIPCGASSALLQAFLIYSSNGNATMCSTQTVPGQTCTAAGGTAVTASVTTSSNPYELAGYSGQFGAIEGGQNEGTVIEGNVCYCESGGNFIGIIMDGNSGAIVSGNSIQGFGNNGGMGIELIEALTVDAISSVSESGNLITVVTSAVNAALQPGAWITVCSGTLTTGLSGCTQSASSYTGRVQIVNLNYVRGGSSNTFSYYVTGTGIASCASSCGNVYFSVMNNVVSNNVIYFPMLFPVSGNLTGVNIHISDVGDIFNNSISSNKIIEINSGAAGTFCLAITGTLASVDNMEFRENDCEGENIGVQHVEGQNTHLLNNFFHNVNTILNYTAGNFAESTIPIPLAETPSGTATCTAAYKGLHITQSDGAASPTLGGNAAGSGSLQLLMGCNGTDWVYE